MDIQSDGDETTASSHPEVARGIFHSENIAFFFYCPMHYWVWCLPALYSWRIIATLDEYAVIYETWIKIRDFEFKRCIND
jgi:hypothetical protein